MSIPSGKASHSIAPSDPCESDNDLPLSPYAPKRAHQRADALPPPANNDAIFDGSRAKEVAPEGRDMGLAIEADAVATGERQDMKVGVQQVLSAVQQAVEAAQNAINESPFDELSRRSHPYTGPSSKKLGAIDRSPTEINRISRELLLDPAQSASPQPQTMHDRPTQEGGEHHVKSVHDSDLETLEASLRVLHQRQAAAMRIPPAPKLPRSRPVAPDIRPGAYPRERKLDPSQGSPRSLELARPMPLPAGRSRHSNAILGVAMGCILTAGIAYYSLETVRLPSPEATSPLQVPSPEPQSSPTIEPKLLVRPEPYPRAPNADDNETLTDTSTAVENPSQPTAIAAGTIAPKHETMPSPAAAAPAPTTVVPSPHKPIRTLEPEVIVLLINEAKKHISTGDVVTARMIFQRVAEAGDATAALELAASYDPTVLARLGVIGMGADVEKARTWYRIAESFGSAEAKQRLRSLDRE